MQKCAIIVAPHWEKGGSNNLFAAQIAYYQSKGWAAVLILVPEFKWRGDIKAVAKGQFRSELKADTVDFMKTDRFSMGLRYRLSKKYYKFDTNGIFHRNYMTKTGSLSEATLATLKDMDLQEICVNWCDNIDFALNIRKAVGTPRTRVVAHSHDVMATLADHSRSMSPAKARNIEVKWLSQADRLVHVSGADAEYFKALVAKPQMTSYITLSPAAERRLAQFVHRPRPRSVLYVGSWNNANPPSVKWFIRQVLPFMDNDVQFYFAGSICDFIEKIYWPQLTLRTNVHLLGRVEDVSELYERAQAVMLPTTEGTGASVKFVEALAMGVPMAMTSLAVRGIPREVQDLMAPFIADRPIAFAEKLTSILEGKAPKFDFRKVYWEHFSNEAWFRRLGEPQGLTPDAAPAPAPLTSSSPLAQAR